LRHFDSSNFEDISDEEKNALISIRHIPEGKIWDHLAIYHGPKTDELVARLRLHGLVYYRGPVVDLTLVGLDFVDKLEAIGW
jgi:hypothetical protein